MSAKHNDESTGCRGTCVTYCAAYRWNEQAETAIVRAKPTNLDLGSP